MASKIIDMKMMRYLNLFARITRIPTTNCFVYNNTIIFAVPQEKISMAVGKNGANVRKLGETLRKKIKVIGMAEKENIEKFISSIVEPVGFTKVEVRDGEVVITAGRENKASLIGRKRVREQELTGILNKFFGITKLRIA